MRVINGKVVKNNRPSFHTLDSKSGNTTRCRLLIKKYDERDNSVEFQYGEVDIPGKSSLERNKLIGSLGQKWLHKEWPMMTVAHYISHSPSLAMMRMGLCQNQLNFQTGHIYTGGIDNLACFIEFIADARGVSTKGPEWMTPDELEVISNNLKQQHSSTHDIRDKDVA